MNELKSKKNFLLKYFRTKKSNQTLTEYHDIKKLFKSTLISKEKQYKKNLRVHNCKNKKKGILELYQIYCWK